MKRPTRFFLAGRGAGVDGNDLDIKDLFDGGFNFRLGRFGRHVEDILIRLHQQGGFLGDDGTFDEVG